MCKHLLAGFYKLIMILALLIPLGMPNAMATDWDYKGFGGWRTHDGHGGWVKNDDGYIRDVTSIHECKQLCEHDNRCKGVEYVSTKREHTTTYQCEVHYDDYAHCDQKGGSRGVHGEDGCHVIRATTDEPVDTGGRDEHGQCYAWDWRTISFANTNWAEVRPDPHDHYQLKAVHSAGNTYFDITVHHDCTITFKAHENQKYVSNESTNHYHLVAEGNHIGDEDRYKVYRHHDGRYLFKSIKHNSWVYTDYLGYVTSDPHQSGYSQWDERRYHVTLHH